MYKIDCNVSGDCKRMYKIDYNADGDWRSITEQDLRQWYKMHVKGNPDYPSYYIWLTDMIKMDLVRRN